MPHNIDGRVFHGPRGGKIKPDRVRVLLIRDVIEPLKKRFPTPPGERGFEHGRVHGFRHYFCSAAANAGVPMIVLMVWLGHRDSGMVRHYFHLHDTESQEQMQKLDFAGDAGRNVAAEKSSESSEASPGGPTIREAS
ncbi:MAG: tyrosine-type recombinase/integrase [Planctomycetes bacterium]|nr:tyrosine-type recombinase/integrase [Planctomycetota bacterium]